MVRGRDSVNSPHLEWLAANLGVVRFFEDSDLLHVRVGVPLDGGGAAVAILPALDVAASLREAVKQVRAEVESRSRRAPLALV